MPEQNKLTNHKIETPTQQYLDIAEVKDDTVIMRDGTLRAVLSVSSINFSLKSEDEQNAIISSYVSFLNNLTSSTQIVVQSRELNIEGYLMKLRELEKKQTNKLLKSQTNEYINYIKELISIGKIMSKSFFVIVAYSPFSDKRKGFFSLVSEALRPATSLQLNAAKFARYKEALARRVDSVVGGLESLGVEVNQLSTQELIELYYKNYNPDSAKNQPLAPMDQLRVEV